MSSGVTDQTRAKTVEAWEPVYIWCRPPLPSTTGVWVSLHQEQQPPHPTPGAELWLTPGQFWDGGSKKDLKVGKCSLGCLTEGPGVEEAESLSPGAAGKRPLQLLEHKASTACF